MPCVLNRIALHGVHLNRQQRHPYGAPPDAEEAAALWLYFLSSVLGAAMSVFGKLCTAGGLHFFLLVAVRSSVLCLLVLPQLIRHRLNPFAITETFGLLLLRGFFGFASLSSWYLSMGLLPLSDANALSFLWPVLVALMAPSVLGEATPRVIYLAMPVSLLGMLMVAQPSWLFGSAAAATSTLGVAAGILQAFLSAGSKLTIRVLSKHNEPLECILFSMGFVSTLGAIIGCLVLPGPQLGLPQHSTGWLFLGATSLLAFAVQLSGTAALRRCNASKAASLDYTSLLWTLLADGLVFHKLPNSLSMVGAGVITAASLGSMLCSCRAHTTAEGQGAGGGGSAVQAAAAAAAMVPPRALQYKKAHYLASAGAGAGPGAGSRQAKRAVQSGSSSSEAEAVPLIQSAAAAAAAAAGTGSCSGEERDAGVEIAARWAAAALGGSGGANGGTCSKHTAKLAVVGWCQLTDSSKSWRLGTEVEALAATGTGTASQPATGSGLAGSSSGFGASDGKSSMCVCADGVELLGISCGLAALRTSTEKEQALAAAGK